MQSAESLFGAAGNSGVGGMAFIVTLGVSDIIRSTEFYQTGLGFDRIPYDSDTISFFAIGDAQLALFPREELARDVGVPGDGAGFPGIRLAWTVDSSAAVVDALNRAVTAGGTLIKHGQPVLWGGFSGYFADLDGHLWEVACGSAAYDRERVSS